MMKNNVVQSQEACAGPSAVTPSGQKMSLQVKAGKSSKKVVSKKKTRDVPGQQSIRGFLKPLKDTPTVANILETLPNSAISAAVSEITPLSDTVSGQDEAGTHYYTNIIVCDEGVLVNDSQEESMDARKEERILTDTQTSNKMMMNEVSDMSKCGIWTGPDIETPVRPKNEDGTFQTPEAEVAVAVGGNPPQPLWALRMLMNCLCVS